MPTLLWYNMPPIFLRACAAKVQGDRKALVALRKGRNPFPVCYFKGIFRARGHDQGFAVALDLRTAALINFRERQMIAIFWKPSGSKLSSEKSK